ncbi:YaiI/YqxD family protein [Salinisphaera sp. Q1T1-3]|uniref:YaiI/YqxD family protein n=1 Tax=Salinisphaera sp. Q1T1-3 TaxID=2321229 RepID=UPI000E75EF5B|nr:YaiI/YqxD family protein [Salinisphaera sp. Q1T1-3]RJS93250.1 YaiI/YqxD family protein [Salinisphaera sp. Q1T1-3]
MQIWVDADACPVVIRQILFRAARRTGMALTLVANHALAVPRDAHIQALQVSTGFDVADDVIVARLTPGDLVITADIPLAEAVIAHGGHALSPRGTMYTADDIAAKRTMRDFMDTLRSSGIHGDGPAAFGERERQTFANALDRWLTRARR